MVGAARGNTYLDEKVAKPGKFSKRFVGKVTRVSSLDDCGKTSSCRNDCVGRSDGWVGDVLVLVENGT